MVVRGTPVSLSVGLCVSPSPNSTCPVTGKAGEGRKDQFPTTSTLGSWSSGSGKREKLVESKWWYFSGEGPKKYHLLWGRAFKARSNFWQDWLVQVALDGCPK